VRRQKAWSGYDTLVRDLLGWALTPEQAFEGATQRPSSTCLQKDATGTIVSCSGVGGYQYLRAADGRVIILSDYQNHTLARDGSITG
jgi:hypothetical protein